MPSIGFQTFFAQTFKIIVDSWKFKMSLLYILWDDWPILMITKAWLSQLVNFKNAIWTLKERYAIKFWFKLGKMPQKRMKYFRLLLEHLAWIENQFLSGIRDSRKAGSLWGGMRGVQGVRQSIYQSWLAKGLGLGLLCWGFKGVQEEIPSEEASRLQIGSVAFPPGQCISPLLHPCNRLFDQDGHQDSSSGSL